MQAKNQNGADDTITKMMGKSIDTFDLTIRIFIYEENISAHPPHFDFSSALDSQMLFLNQNHLASDNIISLKYHKSGNKTPA